MVFQGKSLISWLPRGIISEDILKRLISLFLLYSSILCKSERLLSIISEAFSYVKSLSNSLLLVLKGIVKGIHA
ncbi:hypothetical protein D3C81_1622950 [compost metagenome]